MEEEPKEIVQAPAATAENNTKDQKTTEADTAMILLEKTETSNEEILVVVEDKNSPENSEYDSAGSYSDDEQRKARSRGSDQASHSGDSDTDEGSVILEREEGDGQESVPSKKVDDDEDKKNPQYIPKRGTFYEHDDRTAEDAEAIDVAEAEKVDKDGKKKVWQDKKEKWSHDRFNDTEQAPKSKTELVSIYGYDIRNEDGPPRARRRRRYGRGPNKYTRNWEDEDAYNKPAPSPRVVNKKSPGKPKTGRSVEEFPPLGGNRSRTPEDEVEAAEIAEYEPTQSRQSIEPVNTRETNGNSNATPRPIISENSNIPPQENQESSYNKTNQQQQRVGTGRVIKPKKEIKDSDYRGFTAKTRQVRGMKTDQQRVLPPRNQKKDDFIQSQNYTNKNKMQEMEKDMAKLNVQDGIYKGGSNKHNNQRQGSVPPRLQSEQKGSKRYSSMRQRSLPETANPPNYPTSFYPSEFNPQGPQPNQQALLHQNQQIHPASTQINSANLPPMPPVTAAPLLQAPFPSPFPQPPPSFLQAGVAPPPFIPPQPPQIINYVQGQPTFTPNFPTYPPQFNPVTQPTELYQPQGGITYYSTDQQVLQRPVPQKRPKAAIPIVAPPGNDSKSRARRDDDLTSQIETSVPELIESYNNVCEEPVVDTQH